MDPREIDPETLRPLRRDEYERLVRLGAFEGERVELLEGALVHMSPHGPLHADVVDRLGAWAFRVVAGQARVRVQSALALSVESVPEPDLAIVPLGDYRAAHPSTALLVVEVADSSLRKDRGPKARLYASAGVPEYWIVDLVGKALVVHRAPEGESYADARTLASGSVTPLAFPAGTLVLDDLF
ncbi:MAG: Uma2 family endonuclease [Myxococcales bacterium]|nr:Uma2 family endonuclease [Myxococcales bacterium]